jgi:hypothetical protein
MGYFPENADRRPTTADRRRGRLFHVLSVAVERCAPPRTVLVMTRLPSPTNATPLPVLSALPRVAAGPAALI